jgi:4-hydroxythreonine-4-phosphate dehydrogenase
LRQGNFLKVVDTLEKFEEGLLDKDSSRASEYVLFKSQLYAIGFRHPGQTEFVAERCGVAAENVAMMMVGPDLRTVPVTIHRPLAKVAEGLTAELIVSRARTVARGLARDFGIVAPRLAVAGLNPHAGEAGMFGREEIEAIAPAIAAARADGIEASGPFPPDTVFMRARGFRSFDAVIAMYHDQGLIPIKYLGLDEGVNITIGLPFVRTSPDHGTAFDIAGQSGPDGRGLADPRSLMAAIRQAAALAALAAR